MAALGFSSGLPWALSGPTLRLWMATEHVRLGLIGLTANIGLAYLLKFVWAPIFDEVKPLFFGRRRGWLLRGIAGFHVTHDLGKSFVCAREDRGEWA